MTRGIFDTSVLVSTELGRRLDTARLPDQATVSVISIGELRAGVLVANDPTERALRLATLERALNLQPIPVDQTVAEYWARLRAALRASGQRMPVNDSWIAATALSRGLPVYTQDADYDGVPGLEVIAV